MDANKVKINKPWLKVSLILLLTLVFSYLASAVSAVIGGVSANESQIVGYNYFSKNESEAIVLNDNKCFYALINDEREAVVQWYFSCEYSEGRASCHRDDGSSFELAVLSKNRLLYNFKIFYQGEKI